MTMHTWCARRFCSESSSEPLTSCRLTTWVGHTIEPKSSLQTLALLELPSGDDDAEVGSNSLRWEAPRIERSPRLRQKPRGNAATTTALCRGGARTYASCPSDEKSCRGIALEHGDHDGEKPVTDSAAGSAMGVASSAGRRIAGLPVRVAAGGVFSPVVDCEPQPGMWSWCV